MLIDMFPAEVGRRLVDVSAFRPMPGGAPANVAVAARRLGASSAFIGKVGDDAFGQLLIDTLCAEGVETRGMRVDAEARTTLVFIAMPDAASAEFVFYRNPGADMMLRPDELDETLLRAARALHFGSISLIAEPSRSATLRAIELAREVGALISFDVNYRPSLWSSAEAAVDAIRSALPLAHLIKVNEAEALLLTESNDPMTAGEALIAGETRACIITQGAEGSTFCVGQGADRSVGFIPAFAVEAVDAIGCGDAFMAGMLTRLTTKDEPGSPLERLNWLYLRRSVRYAAAVGALTALQRGVIPALPTAAQVEAFLSNR